MIPQFITSRQNPLIKMLYRLIHTPASYHQIKEIWLEGENLCKAYQAKKGIPLSAVFSVSSFESRIYADLEMHESNIYVLDDALFEHISGLQSSTGVGYLIAANRRSELQPSMPTIILDRLQDPGNVGSILRTASAFGFHQIIALKGTCALWSSKVLRAGMGAHFSLQLTEQLNPEELSVLELPLLATSSHATESLQNSQLPWPCAWVLGNEGQGINSQLLEQSHLTVRIDQPGGEESLNAAIAASICMYESTRQYQSIQN